MYIEFQNRSILQNKDNLSEYVELSMLSQAIKTAFQYFFRCIIIHVLCLFFKGLTSGFKNIILLIKKITYFLTKNKLIHREIIKPLVCITFVYIGIISSPLLLTSEMIPYLYVSSALTLAKVAITPWSAIPLTALVVKYYAYEQMCKSYKSPWLLRLIGCYCSGLFWPYPILRAPLIHQINLLRKYKILRKIRSGNNPS